MASLIGKEIGKYRITERLGQGGMAEVYAGVHTHLDRKVAVKVLHSYLLEGGDFVARFKREAKAVANLRHPNIVQVYDFDIQDDLIFMVMEFVDGVNLHTKLVEMGNKGERIPIKLIGSIINDIASALDYAHTKSMLHRDIKPSNIMIDQNNKAYLTDFGIAKLLTDQKFTATGTLVGTPAYMSPEQGRGDDLTEESDIYSLGVIAFEMLTGQVPYDAKTPIAIVHKQINDPVPNMNDLVDGVPGTAQEVINRALAKSPESRFSSAEALVGALRTALQALESTDPIAVPAEESPTLVDDGLDAPTVTIKAEEMEQPTVVMEKESKKEDPVKEDPPQKKAKDKPAKKPKGEKKKIPLWGYIASAVGVLAIAGVILTQVIDFGGTKPQTSITPSEIIEPTSSVDSAADDNPTTDPTESDGPVEVFFDADHPNEGLSLLSGGDHDYEVIETDIGQVFRSGNGLALPADGGNTVEDWYLEFEINDDLMFDLPEGGQVHIEIEYLDQGSELDLTNHWFNIHYDAHSGGQYGDGRFMDSEIIEFQDTGEYISSVFILQDAQFANRNNGADFRLNPGDGSITIFRVFVTYFPPGMDPDSPSVSEGEALFMLGEEALEQENPEQAAEYFDRAINAGYETGYLYHLRAWAYQNMGQIEQSRNDWSLAIEMDPENYEYWMERGWRKFDLGDLPGALEDLNHARELGPDIWETQFSLGLVYYFSGQDQYNDEAHEAFDQAIELDPTNPTSRLFRGELRLYRFGDPASALEDFEIAVQYAKPNDPSPLNMRGLAYLELGEFDLCVADYSGAIEIDAGNPYFFKERGDCFAGLGDVEMARADYEKTIELSGDNPDWNELVNQAEVWLRNN